MILEAARLDVRPGEEAAFEAAFGEAQAIIASIPGYLCHDVHRCIEIPSRYLLLVQWRSLTDHTVGFRESPQYQAWKALLHHFYEPFPVVEHFQPLPALSSAGRKR